MKIPTHIIAIFALLILIIIAMIVWIAYSLTPSYEQTITLNVPLDNTYRYIPYFNDNKIYKLDKIKIVVTGSLKRRQDIVSTIVPSLNIENIIKENIIDVYRNSLLIHEVDSFIIKNDLLNNNLKRSPLNLYPTNENLSIMFFNKLAPVLLSNGCQLIKITLSSNNTKISHYRYKYRF